MLKPQTETFDINARPADWDQDDTFMQMIIYNISGRMSSVFLVGNIKQYVDSRTIRELIDRLTLLEEELKERGL